jgi:hypothetical protein
MWLILPPEKRSLRVVWRRFSIRMEPFSRNQLMSIVAASFQQQQTAQKQYFLHETIVETA